MHIFIDRFSALAKMRNTVVKCWFLFIIILIHTKASFAFQPSDSLMNELDQAIKQAGVYDHIKLQGINKLTNLLNKSSSGNFDK